MLRERVKKKNKALYCIKKRKLIGNIPTDKCTWISHVDKETQHQEFASKKDLFNSV